MLDQLADTDSAVATKSTARSGEVEGSSVRHLTHEELEAYSNGRLASARLDYCRSHLDSCDACRAELEDIRIFASEMAGFQSAQQGRRKKRRSLAVPLTATAVAMLVGAGVAAAMWWRHEGPRVTQPVVAVAGVQVPAATPAQASTTTHASTPALASTPARTSAPTLAATAALTSTPARTTAPTVAATAAPAGSHVLAATSGPSPLAAAAQAAPTRQTAASTRVTPPTQVAASQAAASAAATLASLDAGRTQIHDARLAAEIAAQVGDASGGNSGFVRLGPFGDDSDARPEFSWQPLPGAVHYSVVVVDAGLHRVARSPALRKTVWRPRRPLRRGRDYLWQVTATLRGGKKVVASGPSPSESVLRIAPLKLADAPH